MKDTANHTFSKLKVNFMEHDDEPKPFSMKQFNLTPKNRGGIDAMFYNNPDPVTEDDCLKIGKQNSIQISSVNGGPIQKQKVEPEEKRKGRRKTKQTKKEKEK
jgi:hypothetical protein